MVSPRFIKSLVVDRRLMLGSGAFNKSHQGLSHGQLLSYVIYIASNVSTDVFQHR